MQAAQVDKQSLICKATGCRRLTSIVTTVSKRLPLSLGDENEHRDPIKAEISGSRSCFSVLNSSIDSDTLHGSQLPVILSFWKSWFRQGPCHCNPTQSEGEQLTEPAGRGWLALWRKWWATAPPSGYLCIFLLENTGTPLGMNYISTHFFNFPQLA